MDWRSTSRSQSRARGSGVGMGMGMGIGMDWRPGSRSHSRSRPSHLHLQTTSKHGFEFDDATNSNDSPNSTANIEGGVAIPQSVRTNGQAAGGAGSGGSGSGRSLLTRSLQMFSESPPVVGYGGWTNISRLAASQQQQHVRQIGEIVQPQHVVSSDEEQQQTEQQEAQNEEDFGGFMSASLPAFHLGFSFAQPLTANATATASPFSKHVRRMSFDHTHSGDGSAASELLGGHQKPLPPKVPESTLVCDSINTLSESETECFYFSTTRANAGQKNRSLIPSPAPTPPSRLVRRNSNSNNPSCNSAHRSLPLLLSHLRMDRQASFQLSPLPPRPVTPTPHSVSPSMADLNNINSIINSSSSSK